MIDIVFLIIAIYVSIFTWITKKDIKSNEKNDFYVPASFIIAFSVIGVTVLFDGSDYGTVPLRNPPCIYGPSDTQDADSR